MESEANRPWLLQLSESKWNYWGCYVVNFALLVFFLAWDAVRVGLSAGLMAMLFVLGVATWTLTEYVFHRYMYHMGMSLTVEGHRKHHDDPTAYIAMPWIVTPLLFLPIHQLAANYMGANGFSTFLGGWIFGYEMYGFTHHCLHHYKMPFAWLRHLQSQHRIHHAIEDTNYGVTNRFWDRVFGTEFKKGVSRVSDHQHSH
jgi:sterol desaturase/sphingolipid hydroxylase (fatty acid hydroxylase superfamily)